MNRVLILLALLSAGCHHEHAEDRVIEARAFVVTDGEGRPRGLWEYRAERKAITFSLLDEEERLRANVMVFGNQPTMNLIDAEGTIRANLALRDDSPSLTLSGPDGAERVVIGMDSGAGASPQIAFVSNDGTWFSLGPAREGGGIVIRDAEGEVLARIAAGD